MISIIKKIISLIIVLLFVLHISAQVTIGSTLPTQKGSLLDLKEQQSDVNNINSSKGLALPRVKLTDINNLYPMFETSPGSGVADNMYNTPVLKQEEDIKHSGLIVYNIDACTISGAGIYVWNGAKWVLLGSSKNIIPKPDMFTTYRESQRISDDTILIHLPSGMDLRTFPSDQKFNFDLNWISPSFGNMTIKKITETVDGGLKFINNSNPANWTSLITSSPVAFDYEIQDMSDIIQNHNANKNNPFRSRETAVTFELPANDCYPQTEVTVKLNQTNYRLTIKRENGTFNDMYRFRNQTALFSTGTNYYRFIITSNKPGFTQETNARFVSNYTTKTAGIISDIKVPVKGGKDLIDGTANLQTIYPIYDAAQAGGKRGKTAGILTYIDTAAVNRYYPVEMHLIQCNVYDYEMTNIDNGDVLSESQWAQKVLKHTDQDGNLFYSADFGSAGRWMITNLAATTYDTESGLNAADNPVPYVTVLFGNYDAGKKKYAYPITNKGASDNTNWGTRPSDWRWEEGIFYNWFAATGRPYDSYNDLEGNTNHEKRQGICPNGWYLPSDKDWTDLEKAIYSDLGKFSTYDAVDLAAFGTPAWNSAWDTQKLGYTRGNPIETGHVGHGAAMKDICLPKGSAFSYIQGSKNYSKEYHEGGFNATLVGRIKAENETPGATGEAANMIQRARGYNVDYWTSSQNSLNDAWFRGFQLTGGGVQRTTYIKAQLHSVRCKKK